MVNYNFSNSILSTKGSIILFLNKEKRESSNQFFHLTDMSFH